MRHNSFMSKFTSSIEFFPRTQELRSVSFIKWYYRRSSLVFRQGFSSCRSWFWLTMALLHLFPAAAWTGIIAPDFCQLRSHVHLLGSQNSHHLRRRLSSAQEPSDDLRRAVNMAEEVFKAGA